MLTPPFPPNEAARLAALRALKILDTPPEERFDRIIAFARDLFQVPIALVSLVDQDRQWFKSRAGLDAPETPRSVSFCGHAILSADPFVVEDATVDERFRDNPLVTGPPFVRFYAGMPLNAGGFRLGTLCLIDHQPRRFTDRDRGVLTGLAGWVERELTILSELQTMAIRLESQARLEAVLDGIADGVITSDPSGEILTANAATGRILRCDPAALIGRKVRELVPERDRAAHDEYMRRLDQLPDPLLRAGMETTGLRADGSEFPVELSFSRLNLEGGRIYSGILRDISERKDRARIESLVANRTTALRESEGRTRAIVENIVDGIVNIDERGSIETVNSAAERLFGYSTAEMIGHNVKMLMPEPYQSEHDGYLRNYLGTGVAKIIGSGREVTGRRKDGSTFPMELAVSEMQVEGERMFTGIVRDISERKAAEAELQSLSLRLRLALESAQLGAWDWDVVGNVLVWDDQMYALYGIAREAFEGAYAAWLAGVHPADRARCDEAIQAALRGEKPYDLEFRVCWPDGAIRWIKADGQVLRNAAGQAQRMVGINYDVTGRKQVERMKNEFISTVSHELRTPLTSIRGALGLVIDGFAGEVHEQAREMINIAHNNSERLVRLINDILDMEKIEAGKMTLELRPVELRSLLERAVADNAGYASEHQVRFEIRGRIPELEVYVDHDRMLQVLANLLSNAAKFSPAGETVAVSAVLANGSARISVEDRGPGIPEEFQQRIFGKFAQADSSDTRQKGGTGLGLSITKAIVESHGGTIGFDTSADKGTVFHFDLPVRSAPRIVPAPAGDDSGAARILICEDDPDIAQLLSLMLSQGGFQPEVAYTAKQAKEMLSQKPFVAMTLDLALPDQDGITLMRELRSQGSTRDLPIIVVSAKAEQGQKEINGDAVGVIDWLEKPIDADRLARALRAAVQSSAGARPRILHIEDDLDILSVVAALLGNNARLVSARTLKDAIRILTEETFDLVILDLGLPDGSGEHVLPLLQRGAGKGTPVIIFSAQDVSRDMVTSIEAVLVKSKTTNEELLRTIKSYMARLGSNIASSIG